MGRNDSWIDSEGVVHRGSLNITVGELEAHRDRLEADIRELKFKGLPMLTGTGFIVIDPKNPRFTGLEHATTEEAQEEANDIAYASGKADVVIAQPTELLKQALANQALPAGAPIAEVKSE